MNTSDLTRIAGKANRAVEGARGTYATLDASTTSVERMAYDTCDSCNEPATHRTDDGCGVYEYACMDHRTDGVTWTRD